MSGINQFRSQWNEKHFFMRLDFREKKNPRRQRHRRQCYTSSVEIARKFKIKICFFVASTIFVETIPMRSHPTLLQRQQRPRIILFLHVFFFNLWLQHTNNEIIMVSFHV